MILLMHFHICQKQYGVGKSFLNTHDQILYQATQSALFWPVEHKNNINFI